MCYADLFSYIVVSIYTILLSAFTPYTHVNLVCVCV